MYVAKRCHETWQTLLYVRKSKHWSTFPLTFDYEIMMTKIVEEEFVGLQPNFLRVT